MEHVIPPPELARRLNADDVVRLFHYDHGLGIARGIAAILAEVAIADVVAEGADAKLVFDVEDGLGEALGVLAAGAQHVEGDALRGLLADAWKALEFGDEPGERFGEIGHG